MATTQGYYILAYSPSTQQTQREFDLVQGHTQDAEYAQRLATSFAARLNQSSKIKDWQAKIEFHTMGIETLVNNLNNAR